MIVAYSYVDATTDEAATAFEEALSTRGRAVERFPGFVRFEFRRDLRRRNRYVIATWWNDRDDLRVYLASEEHRRTHERLSPEHQRALGPAHVEIHEIVEASPA